MSYPSEFISVFARNCEVRSIGKDSARSFMEANHRFGWSKCRYCYGLFISRKDRSGLDIGDMVAASCFSNARRWKKGDKTVSSYEWVRYASVGGIRVSGGMGKMLKHFIEEIKPDDIMSYADLSSPDGGKVYSTLGFVDEGLVERDTFRCEKYRLNLK